ncbi:MAG: penicillin-insensitive murein endopeptidase [Polyangiaceae bacterium]
MLSRCAPFAILFGLSSVAVGCAPLKPPSGAATPAAVTAPPPPATIATTSTDSASQTALPSTAAEGSSPDDASEEEEGLAESGDDEDTADASKDPDDMDEFDGSVLDVHGDGAPAPASPRAAVGSVHSPLEKLDAEEIKRLVREDMGALGPISLGLPNRGRLINGVQMPKGDHWSITDPSHCWGTQETVDNLTLAIEKVNKTFENTPKLYIGHISAQHGGHLKPHKSHQAGRDVDIGYYYANGAGWYTTATADNLDKPRTWALVKALIQDTPVEMIFIDTAVQRVIKDYAASIGEDKKWLDEIFQVGSKGGSPIIRHVKGHASHIHVRFFSPIAQASARTVAKYLPRKEQPVDDKTDGTKVASSSGGHTSKPAKQEFILHKARSGDTLDSLARHYGVTVKEIQDANGLSSNKIKQKATYRIPKKASAAAPSKPTKEHKATTAKHGGK